MNLYKGIFWFDPNRGQLIVRKVACDHNGTALEAVEYSSKSGDNFNHKAEWAKLPRKVTEGHPYNYYPRGRVEIKKNKATVYFHPVLNEPYATQLIANQFGINSGTIFVREVPDGSDHYKYLIPLGAHKIMCYEELIDETKGMLNYTQESFELAGIENKKKK